MVGTLSIIVFSKNNENYMRAYSLNMPIFKLAMRYLNFLKIVLLSIVLILSGCEQGFFESKRFYFPEGSEQFGFWTNVVIITFETPPGSRSIDTNQKRYYLLIKNKKDERLYSEVGEMMVGRIVSSVKWKNVNSINIVIKGMDGKILMDKTLDYDPSKNVYTIRK